jgi:hypothetical protein
MTCFVYETIEDNGEIEPKSDDDIYWEEYWNTFQVPRTDFTVGKKRINGAELDATTADGPVHLVWNIQETLNGATLAMLPMVTGIHSSKNRPTVWDQYPDIFSAKV